MVLHNNIFFYGNQIDFTYVTSRVQEEFLRMDCDALRAHLNPFSVCLLLRQGVHRVIMVAVNLNI